MNLPDIMFQVTKLGILLHVCKCRMNDWNVTDRWISAQIHACQIKKCMLRGKEKQIRGQMQPHHFRFLKVNRYLNLTAVSNYLLKYPMQSSQTTRLHLARSRTAVPAKWASISVSTFLEKMKQLSGEDYRSWHKLSRVHAGMLLVNSPPTHPTTLQSSASEFPQVESCILLPSLSFGGSTKSNCLGESKNEAHECGSGSAEFANT